MSLKNIIEKLNKMNSFLESLKKFVENVKSLWLFIFPIAGLIISAFNFNKIKNFIVEIHLLSEENINFISNNSIGIISIFLVIIIIILVRVIRRTGKKGIEASSVVYNILYKLHNELIHKIRNATCELYSAKEKLESYKDNQDAIQELQMRTFDSVIYNLQNFIDTISDYLSQYNNDVISVCVKIIDSGQENIDNPDKTAKTLVRSKNTNRDRKRTNESITVGKNTDFKHLCDGTNIWYHGVDLKKLYDNNLYETEADIRDWQLKYNSTIVVPIRYYDTKNGILIHDILGFLCIDSKNTIVHWDDIGSLELQYLAIFADSIYNYIKLFRRIFNER